MCIVKNGYNFSLVGFRFLEKISGLKIKRVRLKPVLDRFGMVFETKKAIP